MPSITKHYFFCPPTFFFPFSSFSSIPPRESCHCLRLGVWLASSSLIFFLLFFSSFLRCAIFLPRLNLRTAIAIAISFFFSHNFFFEKSSLRVACSLDFSSSSIGSQESGSEITFAHHVGSRYVLRAAAAPYARSPFRHPPMAHL